MLAVQMAGTHTVAMKMLAEASSDGAGTKRRQECGSLATKLLRLEALAKIRRKGEQKVVVEHVHVHEGGQAIVGMVNDAQGGGYRGDETENVNRPQAPNGPPALEYAAGATVRCQDEIGDAVQGACGEGKAKVPNARGRRRKRGS